MHTVRNYILGLFLVVGGMLSAQTEPKPAFDIQLEVDLVYLASDYLEGRETGTMGELKAAQYLAHRFAEIGATPAGTEAYFQPFDFKYKPNPHAEETIDRKGMNVVAFLDKGAKTTVVIGAHYDHLGMGNFGSRHTGEPAIHNGADDNASGVAAMLWLAEALAKQKKSKNNYLFIGFSGEELGLYGSKYFVANPTVDLSTVNYMLNMDMVGRLQESGVLSVNGTGTSPAWDDVLGATEAAQSTIIVKKGVGGIGPSDHTSFYLKDIPVLHFFSGQHNDYHKPIDDSEFINFAGIQQISEFIVAIIRQANGEGKLAFSKTKDESQGRQAARFKVSLGVMPDYVYNGEGMRIDGVLDGRAAQAAGLENGDVIIQIGEVKVKDIYDYMEGLSQYEAGQSTTVVVRRGSEEKTFEVNF
ncbi:MAG: M20/M25/M40 family metallo-hydrolase [Bacteroidota bacterium]